MMNELVALIVGVVLVIASAAFTIFVTAAAWAAWPGPKICEAYGEGMHLKTEYRFWYGCFVTLPDGSVLPEKTATQLLGQKYGIKIEDGRTK